MKYNTVIITPNHDTWKVSYRTNSLEREDVKTVPLAVGSYHYPETMSDEEATKELLQCMINRHEEEINNLKKSLKALKDLLKKYT